MIVSVGVMGWLMISKIVKKIGLKRSGGKGSVKVLCLKGVHSLGNSPTPDSPLLAQIAVLVPLPSLSYLFLLLAGDLHQTHKLLSVGDDLLLSLLNSLHLQAPPLKRQAHIPRPYRQHLFALLAATALGSLKDSAEDVDLMNGRGVSGPCL
jgi:hypothetical protein